LPGKHLDSVEKGKKSPGKGSRLVTARHGIRRFCPVTTLGRHPNGAGPLQGNVSLLTAKMPGFRHSLSIQIRRTPSMSAKPANERLYPIHMLPPIGVPFRIESTTSREGKVVVFTEVSERFPIGREHAREYGEHLYWHLGSPARLARYREATAAEIVSLEVQERAGRLGTAVADAVLRQADYQISRPA
jgi:hypothetical protein